MIRNAGQASLAALLRERARSQPEAPAVSDGCVTLSYAQLAERVHRLACGLHHAGLRAGERIAVLSENRLEYLELELAAATLGAIVACLNWRLAPDELRHCIRLVTPSAVFVSERHAGALASIDHAVPQVVGFGDDFERLRSGAALDPLPDVEAEAGFVILYTSGTTGRSKGAMLTHGNLLSNARVLHGHWGWRSDDVLIHALPIFHVHGLFVASHGALLAGARMIWLAKFDPRKVIERLPEATVFMGVPTLYVRLLAEPSLSRQACAHMRLFISGSAPLLIETFNEWSERTGHTILERYGMSETIMLTSNPYDPAQGERRGGTVGLALPGVGLRIRDDKGHPLASGEIGHIEVKGPNVFKGYWRMPEKTAEDFTTDLWFKTGDVGKVGADGYVTIVGRSKDLIISGGYNVYPAEIEGYLNEMPGVAESAVIGVPHADFGEAVVAVVVPKPGTTLDGAALSAALKSKIANFKVPKATFIVADLPRNAMGKVQKNLLREQHKALFAR